MGYPGFDIGRKLISASIVCLDRTTRTFQKPRTTMHRPHRTPEYVAWENMIQRCTNPKFKLYSRYGGRGISIAPEWLGPGGFDHFLVCVGNRPSPEYTLDRENNNEGYRPGNVRWAIRTTQNRNTSKNVLLTAYGQTKTLAEWCLEKSISRGALRTRLYYLGWSTERALDTPVRSRVKLRG